MKLIALITLAFIIQANACIHNENSTANSSTELPKDPLSEFMDNRPHGCLLQHQKLLFENKLDKDIYVGILANPKEEIFEDGGWHMAPHQLKLVRVLHRVKAITAW